MAIPFHKRINSIEAILNSINNDPQVYRWFIKFISHPTIRTRLKDSREDQERFVLLKKITSFRIGTCCLLTLLISTVLLTNQRLLLTLCIPILFYIHKLSSQQKKNVSEISGTILKLDGETINLESKTLYQICEYYGKILPMTSLVTVIAKQDDILRKTVIYACVLTCLIYPIDLWNDWIILASFILARVIINTPLVFDRLK